MRKTYETDDADDYSGQGTRRLKPPARLQGRERQVFVDTVLGCAAGHFQPADLPLLERYAEAVALAEQAAGELTSTGAVTSDGKPSAWFAIHASACKTVTTLALRLRLGPQSRAPRAPKTTSSATSFYDRMELEGDDDDGDVKRN
jgi:hypothetical protein